MGSSVLHGVNRIQLLPETLEIFHLHQLDFNPVLKQIVPVLHCAARGKGGAVLLNKLVDLGANLYAKDNDLNEALHDAAQFRNLSGIRVLLERGCDINVRNKNGNTPLHSTFVGKRNYNLLETIRTLLDNGADINAKDINGYTPLHFACIKCKSDDWLTAIRLLATRGADLRATDKGGQNMLHRASIGRTAEEFHELVTWIVESTSGDMLQWRAESQCNPLHYAVKNLELKESTLDLMLKFVNINNLDKNGFNVLFYGVEGGRGGKFIEMLVRKGADWRRPSNSQFTLLHQAARYQNLEALRIFIGAGCAVNARDGGKDTPLHWAFKGKADQVHEIASVLLENGADVNAINSDGFTPVDLAAEKCKNGTLEAKTLKLLKPDV